MVAQDRPQTKKIGICAFRAGHLRLQIQHTSNMLYLWISHCNNGYTNVPQCYVIQGCIQKFQDSTCKKEVCLPWMLNSSITFKVLPFCTNTAVPAFLPCLEASLEVPFWNCVKYPLRFLLNFFNCVESSNLHPKLQLGEEEKVTGGQIG